ncbi:MAG: hypothetical protein EAX96_08445 [Candidatus Lokiarchaeota archaeon]|nr:hypothetical protein [Candidatus Lokiarchaeota archaeon]
MSELDELNIKILQHITNCTEDNGVEINYTNISDKLGKHRITIKRRIEELLKKNIINFPICYPYGLLYKNYPLFIIVYADLPPEADIWMKEDKNIFAGFRIIDGNYNTLLLEFHQTVLQYQNWRANLTRLKKIPSRKGREPSISYYLSNDLLLKNDTTVLINLLREELTKHKKILINKEELDATDFDILECLLYGENDIPFFKVNEYKLSLKLNVHRKTIEKRIQKMIESGLISKPKCYFKNYFAPTGYYLVCSFIEIAENEEEFLEKIKNDNHVPIVFRTSTEKYNILKFSVHNSMDHHLKWNEQYRKEFFKAQKVNYLSENSIIFIDGEKIWNNILEIKMKEQENREQK